MVALKESNHSKYQIFSQTHPGTVRQHNEDACLDMPESGVLLVADGMGGHKAGDVASKMLVDIVKQAISETSSDVLDLSHLHHSLQKANRKIHQYSCCHLKGETIGTTVVLLFLRGNTYHCLWAGDSRIYLYRHQKLIQLTRDHSQVMDMVDKGYITADEVEKHPMANIITRAVGVSEQVEIDHISGRLNPGDRFLLCSDGLTKELPARDVSHCLQANELKDAGLALIHSALVKGASDNVTVMLVQEQEKLIINNENIRFNNEDTVPVFNQK